MTLKLGARIEHIDAQTHVATTGSGEKIAYRHLIWAAGGYARPLPVVGGQLAGVHVIRTRAQVDALRADVASARDIVVIGGGYIGLEAAAVLVGAGKHVTVLEAQERVLARVAAEPISRFYEAEHRAHGVDLRTSVGISSLEGESGRVAGVLLGDGTVRAAQVVIVGIGLLPHQAVLAQAGAPCGNGVEVDAFCRTGLPDVFAIGDCASHPNRFAGGARVRLESVPNAIDQAKAVAATILGEPAPYDAVPWFWSHQYDLKLQTAGLNVGYDETVVRGVPESRSLSLIYLRKRQVIAVDAVNSIKDFMAGKLLVERGASPDPALPADPDVPLKSLAERAL